MPEPEAERAIVNMTSVTDRIVFSSSPDDFVEPTHVNVKPAMYWLHLFAANGFSALPTVALPSITPYALAFERSNRGREDVDLLIPPQSLFDIDLNSRACRPSSRHCKPPTEQFCRQLRCA